MPRPDVTLRNEKTDEIVSTTRSNAIEAIEAIGSPWVIVYDPKGLLSDPGEPPTTSSTPDEDSDDSGDSSDENEGSSEDTNKGAKLQPGVLPPNLRSMSNDDIRALAQTRFGVTIPEEIKARTDVLREIRRIAVEATSKTKE